MDQERLRWLATAVQQGGYLHYLEGGHMAMYDDQERYVHELIEFVNDCDITLASLRLE